MGIDLYEHQKSALVNLDVGKILCGGVGTGKSRTALAYFHTRYGGELQPFKRMTSEVKPNLYIITTAKKRDEHEWEDECIPFIFKSQGIEVTVDSWNNIKKYIDVTNGFFIFDEQRVVGKGSWVKCFLKIARHNPWILLTATPGDTWQDYVPVFIANGFYKNRTDFTQQHIIFAHNPRFPQIAGYRNTGRLVRLRERVLVRMTMQRHTEVHHEDILCEYNTVLYKEVMKNRFDIYKNEPIQNASGLCYVLRRVVNSDDSRIAETVEFLMKVGKAIIFYNFDYEREMLIGAIDGLPGFEWSEWSGHAHQEISSSDKWAYLVQYNAGNEGWNCVKTNTIIFFSQNYSYKVMVQAAGRIDRMNTPYHDLYYYHLVSTASIDRGIKMALSKKKKFNEMDFAESVVKKAVDNGPKLLEVVEYNTYEEFTKSRPTAEAAFYQKYGPNIQFQGVHPAHSTKSELRVWTKNY